MSFVIQRFIWDIDYPQREKAFALQGRCSRLFTAAAVPILEDVFASRIPPGRDFRFDTLSLDLGVIDAALLERDFPERFREALVRALFERMGPVGAPASAAAAVFSERPLEALEHFLLEGALPWWASQQAADAPQALLERLCAELPGQLRPLLLQAGQLTRVRRRLAYQFPDPALRATVELIVPGEGIFIGGYHQTLVRVQQETRWAYGETAGFAREVWLLILTFLLRDMAGQFNRRAFVRQTLEEMAAHYNVSYVELLSVFAEGLRLTAARFQDQDALQRIIRELAVDAAGVARGAGAPDAFAPPGAAPGAALDDSLERLGLYLSGTTMVLDVPERRRLLATLIDRQPTALRALLLELGQAASVRERMTDVFEDAGLHGVVRLEEPAHAGFIIQYATYMTADRHLRAEPGSLRKVVWMLILGYLWNERGSVFNTRMFLERQIRGLADHYHLSYAGLLSLLVGDQAAEWGALEPTTLFHLLADLWQGYAASPEGRGAAGAARGAAREDFPGAHGSAQDAGDGGARAGAIPAEAIALVQALTKLLRGLGSVEGALAAEIEEVARGGDAGAAWVKAWPVLRAVEIPYREMVTLPFDGARFVEAMVRWLAARAGMEENELIAGLTEEARAPALRYLLMALGATGQRQRGIGRLVGAWLAPAQGADPRLEAAIQGWMGKQQPGWDKRTLAFVQDVRKLFLSVIPGTLERQGFEAVFLECVQAFLGDRYGAKDPQSFMEALLAFLDARRRTSPALYRAVLRAAGETHRFSVDGAVFLPRFRAMIQTRVGREAAGGAAAGGAAAGGAAAANARNEAARAAKAREEALEAERQRARKRLPREGLYVRNAGMVLLHPLLATLFNMLEWLEEGQFKKREDQERAVHLLEFAVWGKRETPPLEQDLLLNKLMCGLALEEPVPLEIALTETEIQLGERMLGVMLQQWPRLGHTSAEGLRAAFLQRAGGLTEMTGSWTLRVEQRGVDVLLPFLPWGWSMIKTSWMQKTLNVEWT